MAEYTYRCNECGEEFDEPGIHIEVHPEVDWGYEEWSCCPHCGGFDFEEIKDEEEEDYEED